MSTELVEFSGKIFLCGQPTSMVYGLPGLAKKVRTEAKRDPKDGNLYVFVAKDFRRIKLFYWDKNGYAMWYKHVPQGVFIVDRSKGYPALSAVNLRALLSARAERIEAPQ